MKLLFFCLSLMAMISDKNNHRILISYLNNYFYRDFNETMRKQKGQGLHFMEGKQCYSITTQRFRLCCRHPEWLSKTQELYNQIEFFYYDLLLKNPDLCKLNSQKALRELEVLSLKGRDGKEPICPLPWEKVPVYFRRSAANAGIAAAKSHLSRNETTPGRAAESLNSAVVYYKGMYREFSASGLTLKVYDGSGWHWMHCRLYGKDFPKGSQIMSPSVVFQYRHIMLHVPVKEYGEEPRTVKQRIASDQNICAVQFTNSDAFAVGIIMDASGSELAVKFWRGGRKYGHTCDELLGRIKKSSDLSGGGRMADMSRKYWNRLKNLADTNAHQVSAGIVQFAAENNAALIVFPKYTEEYSKNVMKGCGKWSPIYLSVRIRNFVSYKAWRKGILTIEVCSGSISSVCAKCGGAIENVDRKTNEYHCVNGHQGNRYLNSARNLGMKCLAQFGKKVG